LKLAAPAAPAPAEPTTEPAADAGFGDFGGEEPAGEESAADNKPFDDEPFDAGVEADEDTDPKKFIEQLTGKLGQSLRKYTEEQGGPDFELEKFAINSLLSATHTSEMDEEDKKDIIKKVNTAGSDDSEDSDLGNNDDNADSGNDGNDGGDNGFGDDTEPSSGGDEEGLEEYHIYENEDLFLANPKKNNMFQEGSNDILDEEADRCTRIAKSKYDVWPSAYASGAVVKCRQGKIWKGLKEEDLKELGDFKNMTDEQIDEEWSEKYKKSIDCNNPKGFSQKAHCQGRKKQNESIEEAAKKTDFSKEKESGLHGWFSRRGGEGSQGWVDCNTCRDGKCKPCGRKDGEERSKYPSCRPTPSACKTKGKGDSWGKKAANESDLTIYENYDGESNNYMFWLNLKGIHDDAVEMLHMDKSAVDELIENGHQWALEHVITSKDDIEEVYHFLEGNLETHNMMEAHVGESNNYMFWSSLKTIAHASGKLLEMDKTIVDEILSNGHGWAIDHIATSNDDMEEVYHFLANTLNAYDGDTEGGYEDEYGNVEGGELYEGKYDGKKLGKPMKGDVKKFKVYVKNKKGNVIKVNFGDPNMEIKRDNPERRKSFRARHKCAQAKDRTTPKYWSCKMWSKKPVSKIVEENLINTEKNSIFGKNYFVNKLHETFNQEDMTNAEPQTAPAPVKTPVVKPGEAQPVQPSRKNKPFLPIPEVTPDPKANNRDNTQA
jgi:hypothetical protein